MKIRWKNRDWSKDFIKRPSNLAVIGGKGSGKTTVASLWCCSRIIHTGGKGLITLNTNQQLRDIYEQNLKPLFSLIGMVSYNKVEGVIHFENGSVVHLRSAEASARVEGIEYNWWWGDEVQDYDPDTLMLFRSRVRKEPMRIRLTGMPDDPDAFIYQYLEKDEWTLHEINVRDNPDPVFAKLYEQILRETYSGEMLKRYLDGKRVSLTGTGLFVLNEDHKTKIKYNPDEDLLLSWDFNFEYRAVTGWQKIGVHESGHPMYGCVKSWQMKESTVQEDAVVLCEELKGHKSTITLTGDASGDNRTAQVTGSMWTGITRTFKDEFGSRLKVVIPRKNPNVKDTIQCVNWALNSMLMYFDTDEKNAYSSMVAAKADKHGELDKSSDHKTGGAKSHEVDTVRYAIWYFFSKLYPQGKGRSLSPKKISL
jgi:ABC-type oligopeptide transport system ATPase subunit